MAGHSKWANIKHRKGAQDARRGKLFTKLIREITAATRMSGSDPGSNPRLRTAIDKALTNNMTRDTVDRAIKRGAGGADTDHYEEVRYEGYGPNGVAIMVDCLTDNRNRTVGEVRHAFTKHGGNLGTDGSVAYLFSTTGILSYPSGSDEDAVMAAALEAGAEDILSNEDGSLEVYTAAEALAEVKAAMTAAGVPPENAELTMKASIYVDLEFEDAETVVKLVERLEDLDDVQQVYTNADFSAEVMERLAE
jgi:YebC/PmpR family DNA-binding regulatory protein